MSIKSPRVRTIIAMMACAALCIMLLSGCSQQIGLNSSAGSSASDQAEPEVTSRSYMSEVNQKVQELNTRMESFSDAVSRADAVTMKTQTDSAFEILDQIAAISAPEDLQDLQSSYTSACDELKGALNDYVNLYSEINSATAEHPFDYSSYDARIKEIQERYNSGMDQLEEADKTASEM